MQASVDRLKAQKPNISEYWSDYLMEGQSFKSGNSVIGTTWQFIANAAQGEKAPVQICCRPTYHVTDAAYADQIWYLSSGRV